MCGIAGMASFGAPVSEPVVRRMTRALTHRGPDEEGFHVTDQIGLGARRLWVIDPSGSQQPVSNEDGRVWAVFNGEIYGFKRMRAELEARGHRFRTQGDSEVVVHAYEEWGEAGAEHLRGMFAAALWDEPGGTLLLFRDRLGIKPLYYAEIGDALLFGSEMKALLAAQPDYALGDLDQGALEAFLSVGYVPAPRTMFAGARCLPPGHWLRYRRGAPLEIRPYWDISLPSERDLIDDEAAATALFREILRDAVRDQMVSDVPIGAFVSGGLDSTAVATTMAALTPEPFRTFAIGFDEASYDETPWARRVADRIRSSHVEERISPTQVAGKLLDIVGVFDEPFADYSAIPLYFLARTAHAHGVTVVLTGDGGDELFAGYETYFADQLLTLFKRLPATLRRAVRGGVNLLPVSHEKLSLEQKLKRFVALGESPPVVAHALWRSVFLPHELPGVLVEGLAEGVTERHVAELLLGGFDVAVDPRDGINAFCRLDTKSYLPSDILVKVDRVTMAHSLEARVPLLDERLVDFAFRLSPRLKWRGLRGKRLMRRALRGVVDGAVLRRPKAGFHVPLAAWISGPLRECFRDTLSPASAARTGLFRPRQIEHLFEQHERRTADHSFKLYALLAFQLWFDRHRQVPAAGAR